MRSKVRVSAVLAPAYTIGKPMKNLIVNLDIPENAAVYVFNQFGNMTYSSYMTDFGNSVTLPGNGKSVFLGEDGGSITFSYNQYTGGTDMKYQCLMIDDDETIAASTTEFFNIFDIKTAYVTSFDAAVDYLSQHQVSLLLLDINLGDQSGFTLCKQIRTQFDMLVKISASAAQESLSDSCISALEMPAASNRYSLIASCFSSSAWSYRRQSQR